MTELTPRQILNAFDRTLEEIAAVRDGWVEADFEPSGQPCEAGRRGPLRQAVA
jgi:hypothetical protein